MELVITTRNGIPWYNCTDMEIIKKSIEALPKTVADWLVGYADQVIQRQGRFTIALSGGSTPKALYQLLANQPYVDQIDWRKWHIFWGDERVVPFADERNNAHMAYETLLDHVPIPRDQIHVMRTDVEPEESAKEYEYLLKATFDDQINTFDLVLLGMGDDGHTLSLFPGTAVVQEQEAWVKGFRLESQDMYRITLTAPIANRAACVVFLLSGSSKAATLNHVLKDKLQPDTYPSQLINPARGKLIWFIDEEAGALL